MGVDSGLPDVAMGFLECVPGVCTLGLTFIDCANPQHFSDDPALGWGFYGHHHPTGIRFPMKASYYQEVIEHNNATILS
jgi:hypothetical protein